MKVKSMVSNNTILFWIVGVVLVVVSILLVWNMTVSSQVSNTEKSTLQEDKQESETTKHDGVQSFIDVLEDKKKEHSLKEKINAIERLGSSRAKRAIPLLIKYLDYENKLLLAQKRSSNDPLDALVINERDYMSLSAKYPVVGALLQIGKPSLGALAEVIENEKTGSVKSENALFAVKLIFGNDLLQGVFYLEKASTKSKVPNGSKRLQTSAQKLKKIWKDIQDLSH